MGNLLHRFWNSYNHLLNEFALQTQNARHKTKGGLTAGAKGGVRSYQGGRAANSKILWGGKIVILKNCDPRNVEEQKLATLLTDGCKSISGAEGTTSLPLTAGVGGAVSSESPGSSEDPEL